MGVIFKEDVFDICNLKVIDVVSEFKFFQVYVDFVDLYVFFEEMEYEYGVKFVEIGKDYDVIIVVVNYCEY